jgi:ATP phosphoribosyltransferase
VIPQSQLKGTITALRKIGGSGVVVSPVQFIFEEEPRSYRKLCKEIEQPLPDPKKMEVSS